MATEHTPIDGQRARLAGAQLSDPQSRAIVDQAFVDGFRLVAWISAGLALAASLSATLLIGGGQSEAALDRRPLEPAGRFAREAVTR